MEKYRVLTDRITDEILEKITKIMSKNISRSSSIFSAEAVRNADLSKYKLDLNLPMDWEFPLSSNRGDKFRMNGFIFLDNLYLECEANGNSEDERKILAYMLDFAMQNPVYDKSTQWPWHDDATANRLLRWCLYYMKLSSLCLPKERELLEKSLAYQAELLFSDEFYTPRHNHGMHQDQALILYAVLYGKGDQQRDYIAKALARTGEYLDFVYTSDGVHKEHSPLYARHIFTRMKFLMDMVQEISPDFSEHVRRYLEGGQKFLFHLMCPNGLYPSLGDSAPSKTIPFFNSFMPENRDYQYIISKKEWGGLCSGYGCRISRRRLCNFSFFVGGWRTRNMDAIQCGNSFFCPQAWR